MTILITILIILIVIQIILYILLLSNIVGIIDNQVKVWEKYHEKNKANYEEYLDWRNKVWELLTKDKN